MPPPDDNLASDPSTDAALDDATKLDLGNEAGDGADGADSSDAQGDTEGSKTLDVVRDVVSKRDPSTASPADGQKKDGEDPDGTGAAADKKEPDDEKFTDVPFNKHPRFQQLLRQRDSFKADATQYRNVQAFLDTNGIEPQQAAEGFAIMAAMRNDPHKAWEMLKPHVQGLLHAIGEVLPPELAKRVEDGEFTVEAARELAKANARVKTVEAGQTYAQQRQAQQQQEQLATDIDAACVSWRDDRLAKDPNFEAKEPALKKEIAWLIQTEGRPNTVAGVKAQLDKAYKSLAPVAAAVKPKTAAPTVGQGVNKAKPSASAGTVSNAQPQARSTLDIIKGVVAARAS